VTGLNVENKHTFSKDLEEERRSSTSGEAWDSPTVDFEKVAKHMVFLGRLLCIHSYNGVV